MINQRLYPDIKLGNGSVTIATDGCYLCSIQQGLSLKGYIFTIKELNQLFKDKGVFPAGSSLLSAATIAAKVGNIFLEGRNEAWNDAKLIAYLKDPEYFVVGEVSGKGIGGSGQHFVKIDRVDVTSAGKVSMTWIDDPWGGLEDQKVTTRYNAFGNILSLRVFRIKKIEGGGNMANMYKGYDLSNPDSMKVAVDEMIKKLDGVYVAKTDMDKALNEQKSQLENDANNRIKLQAENFDRQLKEKDETISSLTKQNDSAFKAGFDEGFQKGRDSVPQPTNPTQPDVEFYPTGKKLIRPLADGTTEEISYGVK